MKKWQQGDTKELIVSFVEIKEIWSYIYIQASQGIQHLHSYPKNPRPDPALELFLLLRKSK